MHGHARRERRDPPPEHEERYQPRRDPCSREAEPAREDAGNDLDTLRPDGQADTDLAPPQRDEIRKQPICADGGEYEGECSL